MVTTPNRRHQHMSHWGMFTAESVAGEVTAVHPYEGDSNPSPMLGNFAGSVRSRSRVAGPAVRRGWLENGPGPTDKRGSDEFVSVDWDELTELLARELRRVVDTHGNNAIFGGSYGWASAGRFHHAQSQVHRFLNQLGGYTKSVHSYSLGATGVIMPRWSGLTANYSNGPRRGTSLRNIRICWCASVGCRSRTRASMPVVPVIIRPAARSTPFVGEAERSSRSVRCATTSTVNVTG